MQVTELTHNWSRSGDAMKCCSAINRVMTFYKWRWGLAWAHHQCRPQLRCFIWVYQLHEVGTCLHTLIHKLKKHKCFHQALYKAIHEVQTVALFDIRQSLIVKILIDYRHITLAMFLTYYLYSTLLLCTASIFCYRERIDCATHRLLSPHPYIHLQKVKSSQPLARSVNGLLCCDVGKLQAVCSKRAACDRTVDMYCTCKWLRSRDKQWVTRDQDRISRGVTRMKGKFNRRYILLLFNVAQLLSLMN